MISFVVYLNLPLTENVCMVPLECMACFCYMVDRQLVCLYLMHMCIIWLLIIWIFECMTGFVVYFNYSFDRKCMYGSFGMYGKFYYVYAWLKTNVLLTGFVRIMSSILLLYKYKQLKLHKFF